MSPLNYKLEFSSQWDVLGPFPLHAREQHLFSPAFPLDLSGPIDFDKKWPSSYADGGFVHWTKTTKTLEGELQISFPEVRWKYLRSFEGWAALQHHAVLRTTFKVSPLEGVELGDDKPTRLVVHHQASYFAVLPKESFSDVTPKWYAGNIYDLPRSTPQIVELPPSTTGEYQLFLSGDYEIRLFGDPTIAGSEVPVQHIKIDVQLEQTAEAYYTRETSQDVICDFVDGQAFGDTIGVGLRSLSGWIVVESAYTGAVSSGSLAVELSKPVKIAEGQTRIIPLKLLQRSPFKGGELDITLKVTPEMASGERASEDVSILLPLEHLPHWLNSETKSAIRATYLYAGSSPTIFCVLPPLQAKAGKAKSPILALHGAGVDIVDLHTELWANAMPRNNESWIIMPSGRTSWGLDWHGPSSYDAWASVSALSDILQANDAWKEQAFPRDTKVVLIGHSNGGQGVWHLATHFPDRVVAAAPAAGYIKSQAYVPLTHSRSAHFIDPMLRAILETSLTPDDNDLHLSNIGNLSLLAVHGGADENVPSWHSRELISTLHTLNPQSDSTFQEDPGQGHWYSSVLSSSRVQEFVDKHIEPSKLQSKPASFTLTVSNPSEFGSLHGWRIHSLLVPGRLGTLRVSYSGDGHVEVSTTNIQRFYADGSSYLASVQQLTVGHQKLSIDRSTAGFVLEDGQWRQLAEPNEAVDPPPTRLQSILSSQETIKISYDSEAAISVAKRLAHDLLTYHRLDVELLATSVPGNSVDGSTVVIGTLQSPHIQKILKKGQTGFRLFSDKLYLEDRLVDLSAGQSYIFLHPGAEPGKLVVVIIYTDEASLERAGRLFPIRTGVAAPSWLCLSPHMDRVGAAGIQAAGVWGSNWKLQPESSWRAI